MYHRAGLVASWEEGPKHWCSVQYSTPGKYCEHPKEVNAPQGVDVSYVDNLDVRAGCATKASA